MKKTAIVNQQVCVACGACAKACPRGAISIFRGCYAQTDTAKCVGCGLCVKACPAGCVSLKERSDVR